MLRVKLFQYLLVLLVASGLNFALPRMMPGSPLTHLAGAEPELLPAADRARLQTEFGLDQPLPSQYWRYTSGLVTGDLGYSFQKHQPVTNIIVSRIGWTLLLTISALLSATVSGMLLGTLATWKRGSWLDRGLTGISLLIESLPSFWLGMTLVAVFAVQLGFFPSFGAVTPWVNKTGLAWLLDVLHHLALPLLTLTLVSFPSIYLTMRAALIGTLGEPYIQVARAKGLGERPLALRHAVRNALLPVATVFTLNLGFAVGGATVVETVFSYPGLGRTLYEAVLSRDYPLMQGIFLVLTLSVIVANLLADLLYPWLDPRVRVKAKG